VVFERAQGDVETISYGSMAARAARTAGALQRLGVGPGDRFHLHLTNRPEFYDAWFAAAVLGAVMVPSNPLSSVDELTHVISHAGCSVSVTQTDLVPAVTAAGAATVVDVNQPWVRPDDHATRQPVAPTDPPGGSRVG